MIIHCNYVVIKNKFSSRLTILCNSLAKKIQTGKTLSKRSWVRVIFLRLKELIKVKCFDVFNLKNDVFRKKKKKKKKKKSIAGQFYDIM